MRCPKALDKAAPRAVLASNTSYLDIDIMAGCLSDPSRLVGLHFFSPAHIMKLLEIVKGVQTSDYALATGYALAKHLRKIPVEVGVCDGFVGNRMLQRVREAAELLLLDGAEPVQIDRAMRGFGYSMGLTRPKTCQASFSRGLTGDARRQRAILNGVTATFRIRSVRPAGLAVRLVLAGMCMRMTS